MELKLTVLSIPRLMTVQLISIALNEIEKSSFQPYIYHCRDIHEMARDASNACLMLMLQFLYLSDEAVDKVLENFPFPISTLAPVNSIFVLITPFPC